MARRFAPAAGPDVAHSMELIQELDSKLLLGRYRVVRQLAEGGMGKVYLARVEGAEGFKRPVVVKVMRSDMRRAEQGNRLFKREAQILSKMQHPAITNIIDFGIEDGNHVMVLEYVHGYAVSDWLDFRHARKLGVPVDICLYIVRRILDALNYAHHFQFEDGTEGEIVHRDVAADNVLLDNKGYVYLLDFGIASMAGSEHQVSTNSGVFRGKLGYAAPETLGGDPATARADQYSAGILLWELLTLETPFQADSAGQTVMRMMKEQLPPISTLRADTPPGLDHVLAKVLQKEPENRYESVRDFSRELRHFQQEDDEDVAQQLLSIVETDFELMPSELSIEPLSAREEALARTFPGSGASPLGGATGRGSGVGLGGDTGLRRLLLGLLIVGGAIALGVGALVALLNGNSGQQVVVVGGEGKNKAASSGDQRAVKELSDFPTEEPEQGRSDKEVLSEAIQAKGAAFEECFVTHLDLAEQMPEATLHFSIGPRGAGSTVSVEPPALASSPLGECLSQAAGSIEFPEREQALSFRVPVRARFARLK